MERMRGEEGVDVAHDVSPEAAPALRVSVSCSSENGHVSEHV